MAKREDTSKNAGSLEALLGAMASGMASFGEEGFQRGQISEDELGKLFRKQLGEGAPMTGIPVSELGRLSNRLNPTGISPLLMNRLALASKFSMGEKEGSRMEKAKMRAAEMGIPWEKALEMRAAQRARRGVVDQDERDAEEQNLAIAAAIKAGLMGDEGLVGDDDSERYGGVGGMRGGSAHLEEDFDEEGQPIVRVEGDFDADPSLSSGKLGKGGASEKQLKRQDDLDLAATLLARASGPTVDELKGLLSGKSGDAPVDTAARREMEAAKGKALAEPYEVKLPQKNKPPSVKVLVSRRKNEKEAEKASQLAAELRARIETGNYGHSHEQDLNALEERWGKRVGTEEFDPKNAPMPIQAGVRPLNPAEDDPSLHMDAPSAMERVVNVAGRDIPFRIGADGAVTEAPGAKWAVGLQFPKVLAYYNRTHGGSKVKVK